MPKAKQVLRELEKGSPGTRFQRLHRKRQQSRRGGLKNALFLAGGFVTIGIGVLTYPIPVIPSELLILASFVLLAQGSKRGALILDWVEVRLRRRFSWVLPLWKRLPPAMKIAISVLWMAALGCVGYVLYRLVRGT